VQRRCCLRLQLVVSVVFPGPVHGAGGGACCEQAQFQDVFKGARVRGNGIVLGHAELICHARGSLALRGWGSLSQYRQFLRVGWKWLRPRSVTRPAERSGGGRRAPGERSMTRAGPLFAVESGLVSRLALQAAVIGLFRIAAAVCQQATIDQLAQQFRQPVSRDVLQRELEVAGGET